MCDCVHVHQLLFLFLDNFVFCFTNLFPTTQNTAVQSKQVKCTSVGSVKTPFIAAFDVKNLHGRRIECIAKVTIEIK